MSQITSVRLPDDLTRKLNRLSKTLDRPKSYLLRKALEEYVEEQKDYLMAMNRLNDKQDRIIPEKELRKSLGL